MKRILLITIVLSSLAAAKSIYWVTEKGTKVVTYTSDAKMIKSLEEHIVKYQKKDKDIDVKVEYKGHEHKAVTKDWNADEQSLTK